MSLYAFPVVDTFLGPKVGVGVLSILGYSTRIISTLAVIIALGPFGVLIPELASHSATENRERFALRAATLIRYALTLLIPVAVWLTLFRFPVITVLLQRGEFGVNETYALSGLLFFNIPGSVFMVLSMLIVRVLLADKRVGEAAALSTLNLGLYFALCQTLSSKDSLKGFGEAFVISWATHALVGLIVLFRRDRTHFETLRNLAFLGQLFASTVALFVFGFGIAALALPTESRATMIVAVPVSFVGCLVVYFGVGSLLGSAEHQRVWGMVSKLARRSRSA